ncbi:MAG: DNA internalization-related competence protein ComEC/Rec2 [bacterium]
MRQFNGVKDDRVTDDRANGFNRRRAGRSGISPTHLCLLAFCVGVIALRFCAQLPPLGVSVSALVLLLALLGVGVFGRQWREWLRPAAALALGFCWAQINAAATLATALPHDLEKRDVVVEGRVLGVPVGAGDYQRFDFAVERLERDGVAHSSPRKVRLKWYRGQPPVRVGERWRFTARFKRARGYQNPGASFNYETYLFQHRIRATGYVRARPLPLRLQPPRAHVINAFRQRVAEFIRVETGARARSGLLAALTVGLRSGMTARDWEVLLRTGTIHLIAISGLHIGLVSGLVLMLFAWCWRNAGALALRLPAPKAGVLAGLLAGCVYALLAGMTTPTQRAVCMLAVVALALFFQRRPFGFETWAIALAAVLIVDPLAPLSAGFWLSFGAVMILIYGVTRTRDVTSPSAQPAATSATTSASRYRALRKLIAWSAVQAVLFIGMAPLLVALFQRVSLVAPLANMIAIPMIGLIAVPLALFGLLLYALGLAPAAAFLFDAALTVINALWALLEWLSASAWAVWRQPSPPLWSLPLAAIGAALLLAPRAMPARWSGLLWMLPLLAPTPSQIAPGEYRYTMLEVGHGLASVVQTRNHLLVYDVGPSFANGLDAGEAIVAPFLQQLGARRIDALVVSHGDNDHSGGQRALLARFDAARVLASAPQGIAGARTCRAGQRWTWDGVRFEMLSPRGAHDQSLGKLHAPHRGNEDSCVLKVQSEFGALLLTGDIGKPTEAKLAALGSGIAADVLQVPHHGSKTSSTEVFLRQVKPAVALNSIGYLNRYRHPHDDVRERYARLRIPLYNTADEGAITVSFSAAGIALHGQRGAERKYWLLPPRWLERMVRVEARR